ncbi:hypothetical protein K1T71_015008 [Dendrolimus kikuchii]|nr:hypothetical protein K1T71_015008 [Dendrolimus kikuchii]
MERVCVSAFFVSSEFESNENDKKRELDEMCEDRDMVELCENVEKTDIFDSEYDQELYEICTMYENLFDSEYDTNLYEICTTIENNVIQSSSHSVQTGQGVFKRSIESDNSNSDAKRQRHDEPSTSTDKLHCETCNILVNRRYFVNHTKSIVHKNNILKSHCSLDNVSVVDSAFGQRIISYKVKNKNQSDSVFQTPELFLELIKSDIFFLIDEPNPHHLLIMSRSLNTHKDLLSALHKLKPKYRTALLKSCDEDEINCICECIHNVLQGKVPIEEKNKKKLKNYKSVLRKLVRKGVNKARKSIIIQKGGAFLPIILGAILSGLVESLVK